MFIHGAVIRFVENILYNLKKLNTQIVTVVKVFLTVSINVYPYNVMRILGFSRRTISGFSEKKPAVTCRYKYRHILRV